MKSEEDKLRKKLAEAQAGDNMDALDKALDDCKRAGLEDEGDITKAEKTLTDMHKESTWTTVSESAAMPYVAIHQHVNTIN